MTNEEKTTSAEEAADYESLMKWVLTGKVLVEAYRAEITALLAGRASLPPSEAAIGRQKTDKLTVDLQALGFSSQGEYLGLEKKYAFGLAPYSELRGSTFRFVLSLSPRTPKQALARYSAIWKAVGGGQSTNTVVFSTAQEKRLTFSEASPNSITFACNIASSKAEINYAVCKELGVRVVRQPGVGKLESVSFGNEGDFIIQLYCPALNYATVQYIVIAFLKNLGMSASVGLHPSVGVVHGKVIASFGWAYPFNATLPASPVSSPVGRSSILIYSILDYSAMAAIFQKTEEELRGITTSLQEELGYVPTVDVAVDALKRVFTEDFDIKILEGSYSDYELSLAAEIEKTLEA